MPRAGPRKVRAYSRELKLTAVPLGQHAGIRVQAEAKAVRAAGPKRLSLREKDTYLWAESVADQLTRDIARLFGARSGREWLRAVRLAEETRLEVEFRSGWWMSWGTG
jgi:hypothetical protein